MAEDLFQENPVKSKQTLPEVTVSIIGQNWLEIVS